MSAFYEGFVIGALVGASLGIVIMSLMVMSRLDSDDKSNPPRL